MRIELWWHVIGILCRFYIKVARATNVAKMPAFYFELCCTPSPLLLSCHHQYHSQRLSLAASDKSRMCVCERERDMENEYSSGLRRMALSPSLPEGGRYSAIQLVFLKCTDGGLCFFASDQDIIIFRVATIVTLLVVVGAVAQAEWQPAMSGWLHVPYLSLSLHTLNKSLHETSSRCM